MARGLGATPVATGLAFLPRKIGWGATRRGGCDGGTPAGSAKRQFCGGSLPNLPPVPICGAWGWSVGSVSG